MSDKNTLKQAIKWLKQIFCGIAYIHINGFLHIDVNYSIILVLDKNTEIVSDYRFLKLFENLTERCEVLVIYRCPEVSHLLKKR